MRGLLYPALPVGNTDAMTRVHVHSRNNYPNRRVQRTQTRFQG